MCDHNTDPARLLAMSILFVSGLLLTLQAHAFGPDGHRAICEVAQAHLTTRAKARLAELIRAHPEVDTFADACAWPDMIRDREEYAYTLPLHYVNLPRGATRYDQARDCPQNACLPEAIKSFLKKLEDATLPANERAIALAFVGHLIGDLQQPLHAGYADDKGANDFAVTWFGEPANLHWVWDTLLLKHRAADRAALEKRIAARYKPLGLHFTPALIDQWVDGSRALISDGIYPPGHALGEPYYRAHIDMAMQRVTLGAERLAAVLNQVLN